MRGRLLRDVTGRDLGMDESWAREAVGKAGALVKIDGEESGFFAVSEFPGDSDAYGFIDMTWVQPLTRDVNLTEAVAEADAVLKTIAGEQHVPEEVITTSLDRLLAIAHGRGITLKTLLDAVVEARLGGNQ